MFWEIMMVIATAVIAIATGINAWLFNRHNKLNIELQCAHRELESLAPFIEFERISNERFSKIMTTGGPAEWDRIRTENKNERDMIVAQIDVGRRMRNRILEKYGCGDMIEEVDEE